MTVVAAMLAMMALGLAGHHTATLWVTAPLAAGGIIAALLLHRRRRTLRTLLDLENRWADRVDRERGFDSIRAFRDLSLASCEAPLDGQTWRDLDMDLAYARMDRTLFGPGASVLYAMLRSPLSGAQQVGARGGRILELQRNQAVRSQLLRCLLPLERMGLGRCAPHRLAQLLWDELPAQSSWAPLFTVMAILAALSAMVPIVALSPSLVLVPLGVFAVNLVIHYAMRRTYARHLPPFVDMSALLRAGEALRRIPGVDEDLGRHISASREITRRTRLVLSRTGLAVDITDLIADYLRVFFLVEVRSFVGCVRALRRDRSHIEAVYLLMGALDALQSVAS